MTLTQSDLIRKNLLILALLLLSCGPALAGTRVALVIGNSTYQQGPHLSAADDARAMAKTLAALNFHVILGTDLGIEAMYDKMVEFEHDAFGAETALFYFAGHALQYSGGNYLFPVDAVVQDTLDVGLRSINLELPINAAAGAANVVVLLDNRRENPFMRDLRELGRAARGGLGDVSVLVKTIRNGALVAQALSDEPPEGSHSAMCAALLKLLPTPGYEIKQALEEVGRSLREQTGEKLALRLVSVPTAPLYLAGEGAAPPTGAVTSAATELEKQALQGGPSAQADLGRRYEYGDGLPQNDVQAAYWYRKSAEQGYVLAQIKLGSLYRNGHGVERDDAQALAWFHKAAEQGNASGQFLVGVMYQTGSGTPPDNRQALAWYKKSAASGFKPAKAALDRLRAAGVK
ncbi:MAG TPA: caspase family protein [Solimonas sp.]|nr:caspase family protein [Solimonas sp.]